MHEKKKTKTFFFLIEKLSEKNKYNCLKLLIKQLIKSQVNYFLFSSAFFFSTVMYSTNLLFKNCSNFEIIKSDKSVNTKQFKFVFIQ